jgi:hypothetical protein
LPNLINCCELESLIFGSVLECRKFERLSNALKEFYRAHIVWNKGRPWSPDIRERIMEGCLNSPIGMGPKPAQEQE